MTALTTATRTRGPGSLPVLLGVIALAWGIAIVAQVAGGAEWTRHGVAAHGDLPVWIGLGLFLVAWEVMVPAMMLPSALPMIRVFGVVAANQPRSGRATAAFLAGYVAVWTGFGAAAFLGDVGLHQTVEALPGVAARPRLIAGSVLVLAGAFQFSKLKDRCLRECRHPVGFLMARYGRGTRRAFRIGRAHGMYCLGCCWALMLVGFAAGVANLWWMAALTAVMLLEKTTRRGQRAVAPVGAILITAGILVLFNLGPDAVLGLVDPLAMSRSSVVLA